MLQLAAHMNINTHKVLKNVNLRASLGLKWIADRYDSSASSSLPWPSSKIPLKPNNTQR